MDQDKRARINAEIRTGHGNNIPVYIDAKLFTFNNHFGYSPVTRDPELEVPGEHQPRKVEGDLPSVDIPDQNQVQQTVTNIRLGTDRNPSADKTPVRYGTYKELSFFLFPVCNQV